MSRAVTPVMNTIIVATTANTIAADGQCSLREAIINANDDAATHADCIAGSGADTIVLQASTTYTLNVRDNTEYGFNGLPAITSQITIEGNGATITRNATATFRLFYVASSGNLTLQNLTLSNGLAKGGDGGSGGSGGGGGGAGLGGAVFNKGVLTILNSSLTGNKAQGGLGGSSTAGAGSFGGSGGGGGLGGNGGFIVVCCNGANISGSGGGGFGGNGANGVLGDSRSGGGGGGTVNNGNGNGGGLANGGRGGSPGVLGSDGGAGAGFNGGTGGGGGGAASGPIPSGTGVGQLNGGCGGIGGGGGGGGGFGGNHGGSGGYGGGGGSGANGSAGSGNTKAGGGGGFGGGGGGGGYNDGRGGNSVFGGGSGSNGGACCGPAGGAGGGGAGLGGAIFNAESGTLTLTASTLSANMAQGGNGGNGYAIGGPVTAPGSNGGQGGSGYGGGVFNYNGTATITQTTFSANNVSAGTGGSGEATGSNGSTGGSAGYNLYTATVQYTCGVTQSGTPATLNLSNNNLPSDQIIFNNGGNVNENVCQPIMLSPVSLPSGRVSFVYNQTITASGGTAPYSFAVTNGSLPSGLSLSSTGLVSGAPNASGTFSFIVTATDANSCIGTLSYSLTINANNAPDAVNDTASTNEDTAVTISVLTNDTDADSDTLSISSATVPANGNIVINANGTITYTPNANFNGMDSFSYTTSDGQGGTDTATVTVNVAAVNDAPDAVNDIVTMAEDTAANISALGNDTDVDGNTLTVSNVTQGTNGSVVINANGTLTYTPNANFNGTDSFIYTISDGTGGSDTATISVNITAVNDAPVATNNSYSTNEDTALNIPVPGVLDNDSDVDSASLSAILVSNPTNGSVSLNANGSFTYTPNANFNGSDSFTYKVSDSAAESNLATVTISVNSINDVPDAVNDSISTSEDNAVTISVLGNDTDVEGNTLSVSAVTQGSNGAVVINPNGTVTYTPNANFNGSDSFVYTISDGNGGSDIATVNVTIAAVNDAPQATDDSATTAEDTPVTVAVLGNDTDVDGNSLTVTAVTQGSNGSVSINGTGTVTYTPNTNFNGSDSFTYTVSDGNGGTATATVAVSITAVNDAPVATIDSSYSTDEDTTLTVAAPGVLSNDSDVEGNALTAVLVFGPSNGTLTLNANGSFTYLPNANFNGTDSFTYKANDGSADSGVATVTITVNAVNDAPGPVNDAATTAEDTAVNISVLSNDTDIEGHTLTITAVTQGTDGTVSINSDGSVRYTPNANFNSTDAFTYTVSDGNGGTATATVTVTISAVNDVPVAANDSFSTNEDVTLVVAVPGVSVNDSDVDGNPLTATVVSAPASGTLVLSTNGSLSYTPVANFFGTVSFSYKVNDGTADSAPATVTITVNGVNDPPVPVNDAATTNQNAAVTISVLANDTDIESNTLSVTSVAQSANGIVGINANGTVTYTPNANFTGMDAFTYTISDGNGGTATATVAVTVNAVTSASVIAVSAPTFIANSGSLTLSSMLTSAANIPLGNRMVTVSIGSGAATQSCTAITSSTGVASCTITSVNQPLGPGLPVQASFAGDSTYFGSSASITTLVFAYAIGNGGGFVIGDQNAAAGTAVTFWGAQWAKKNSLSGGDTSNSFKGFANRSTSNPVTCGNTWFTDPGNSSDPPAGIPSYMAVIVASRITKSGSTISGNTTKVVIVRTNAGYSANPGHSGTGTIVGILCQ